MAHPTSFHLGPDGRDDILVRCGFAAAPERVFAAHVEPDLIVRWLAGADGWTMPVCTVDARTGGAFRYVWRAPGGEEVALGGVFREIVAPERLVTVERYDHDRPSFEATVDTRFLAADGGGAILEARLRYRNPFVRNFVMLGPIEATTAAGYARLAALLEAG